MTRVAVRGHRHRLKTGLEIDVYRRRGTDPAAAFLHRLIQNHDVSDTEFLVDGMGYLTALARHDLSGHLDHSLRNHIEEWFQTVAMRIDRFYSFWRGSPASAERWLRRFRHSITMIDRIKCSTDERLSRRCSTRLYFGIQHITLFCLHV